MHVSFMRWDLIMSFWTLQAGLHYWVLCIRQDRYGPSGCGSEWDGDIEGELLILSESSPDIRFHRNVFFLSLPPHSLLSRLFFVPHWESHPKCVSWVLTDAFYESEKCKCVGIFKRSSGLQTSTIVILSSLPAKTNMVFVERPFAQNSSLAGRAGQHCVNEPQPTQSPIGLRAFSQWKYPRMDLCFILFVDKGFFS